MFLSLFFFFGFVCTDMITIYQGNWRYVVLLLLSCFNNLGLLVSQKPFYLQVTEIFNFSQDDLLTEDMMVLDTHGEVFVWMGQCVDAKEKQKAFEIGQVWYEDLLLLT